jgi:hypothetical protein
MIIDRFRRSSSFRSYLIRQRGDRCTYVAVVEADEGSPDYVRGVSLLAMEGGSSSSCGAICMRNEEEMSRVEESNTEDSKGVK